MMDTLPWEFGDAQSAHRGNIHAFLLRDVL